MNILRSVCAIALLLFPLSANAADSRVLSGFIQAQFTTQAYKAPIYVAGVKCAAKANAVAASHYNAQILSVEQNGNTCIIVLKVPGQNGYPPRIVTRKVSG